MKKTFCIILSLVFVLLLCSCANTQNESSIALEQKITIISNKSQESKTSDSVAKVEKMIGVLGNIYKIETIDDWIGSCDYKIIITIDGRELTYMFGGKTFCDVDGTLYKVKNAEETNENIKNFYDNIND